MFKTVKFFVVFALLFSFNTVWAEVRTINEYEHNDNTVYIVGNKDFYPIEYYNEITESFDGIMPEILSGVSERTGLDFVYVYGDNENNVQLANEYKAQLISSYNTEHNKAYYTNIVTFLSYKTAFTTMNIGWRFTEFADDFLIDTLKFEASKVDNAEINSLLLKYSDKKDNKTILSNIYFLIMIAVLFIILIIALIKIFKIKKSVRYNSITDSTTGIGNLTYFEDKFSKNTGALNYIAYFVMDSNYLQVYHTGTTFTDAVKYVANTINGYSFENDVVARIAENGFVYMFNSENDKSAREHINDLTNQLLMFFDTDIYEKTSYFKVVIYHLKPEDKNSDLLIYNLRKHCTALFDSSKTVSFCSENMLNSELEKKHFIDRIMNAFKNKDFKLYLQFIYDNKTNKIVSAEALSRWDRGEEGIMYPGNYIGEMEKQGIISDFDYYMFEQTCMQLHKWKGTQFDDISISCNITRITISTSDFVERILEISNRYVFDRSKLIIEITEDALENNVEVVRDNMSKCKTFDFRFALDDLGSGYTSLVNLCDYPFDVVKIDRSIMLKTDTESGRALFEGIEAFAYKLGLKTVCEGIETAVQRKYISKTKCDYLQGWYFCKAVPVKEAEELYLQWK